MIGVRLIFADGRGLVTSRARHVVCTVALPQLAVQPPPLLGLLAALQTTSILFFSQQNLSEDGTRSTTLSGFEPLVTASVLADHGQVVKISRDHSKQDCPARSWFLESVGQGC